MVAEGRYHLTPHQKNALFSAVFDKKLRKTRDFEWFAHTLPRDFQLRYTRAFAQKHARIDHEGLEADKRKLRRARSRQR